MEFNPQTIQLFSNIVIATATVGLLFATLVLAVYTAKMVRAMAQPHVVAKISVEKSQSKDCFVLQVRNQGNATAYSIGVKIYDESNQKNERLSEHKIDLLTPNSKYPVIFRLQFYGSSDVLNFKSPDTIKFLISWKRHPNKNKIERFSYNYDMNRFLR